MRKTVLVAVAILLSFLSPAMAATPLAAESESPATAASSDAGYAAYLTGAVAAGAFIGAVVVQVVAAGFVVPALATGGIMVYEAAVAAGGIGGGLAGAWIHSR